MCDHLHFYKGIKMKQVQKGFTLIELMIVVAIIGILAAIAIPAYSEYQAKAKVAAGLAEVSGYKTAHELWLNDGNLAVTAVNIGMPIAPTGNCTLGVTMTTLTCLIMNAPTQVNAAIITWTRDAATGQWACSSTITDKVKFAPRTCAL